MSDGAGGRDWYADIPRSARFATLFGIATLLVSAIGFGYWGQMAPIAGAVVTNGAFVATGHNKVVQHLEGGVVREILVREGDVVEPGQLLIQLDETSARAELRRLVLREGRLAAMEARLRSEAREDDVLALGDEVVRLAASDPDIAAIIQAQRLTFEARKASRVSEIATLKGSIDAIQERIGGGEMQLQSIREQLGFIEEEHQAKDMLLRGGIMRKPEVLALQRAMASLRGEIGRIVGEIGDARERIARTNEQITGVRKSGVKVAVEQMHEVSAELNDVRERIHAARRLLERIQITAPVRGAVVKLRYHTPGGVIEAGKSILEIVPLHEELIIEVRVRPQDINSVKRGQSATVRLTALRQRVTPMISGEVVYVSADALPDETRGQSVSPDVYVARIRLEPREAALIEGFQPNPGMPAEVYITTAERTFFEYVMQPIKDSMSRAFRES